MAATERGCCVGTRHRALLSSDADFGVRPPVYHSFCSADLPEEAHLPAGLVGADPRFGLGGKSSAEGIIIEAGGIMWRGCPLHTGGGVFGGEVPHLQKFF